MERIKKAPVFEHRGGRLVLHCCCAVCSCAIIEKLAQEGVEFIVFFYNPNIHPYAEYDRRKAEIVRYALKMGIRVVDADYDSERWMERMKGHEADPERGVRCSLCFEFRLRATAAYAAEHGYSVISSTLGISRRKNFDQVTEAGKRAASQFPGVTYLDYNWRKNGGSSRMDAITQQEGFYRQSYCGCRYSL